MNNSMSSVIDPCVSYHSHPHVRHGALFFRNPRDYLQHVMKATNMSCLTPEGATSGECDFLSANMYARSLFGKSLIWGFSKHDNHMFFFLGEDALANLSIERTEAGTITGHVRIRSKTQGIALSLGDKITMGMSFLSKLGGVETDCFPFLKKISSSKR